MMMDKRDDVNSKTPLLSKESGDRKKGKAIKSQPKKVVPGTIAKFVREAYKIDPAKVFEFSPELFRVLSEAEVVKEEIDRRYFENYVTERERVDFISQVQLIAKKEELSKEDAIRFLELVAALGIQNDSPIRSKLFKAVKALGLDLNEEEDSTRVIRHGEIAHRIELIRGLLLGLDWSGALLELSLLGKDILIRKSAEYLVGCLSINQGIENLKGDIKPFFHKIIVIDRSAFLSIMNRTAPQHDVVGSTFLRLIDNRTRMLCPVETLLSLIPLVSACVGIAETRAIFKRMENLVQVIWSLPPARKLVFDLGLADECIGLEVSSLYSILIARLGGVPIFASDPRVIAAIEKIGSLG